MYTYSIIVSGKGEGEREDCFKSRKALGQPFLPNILLDVFMKV